MDEHTLKSLEGSTGIQVYRTRALKLCKEYLQGSWTNLDEKDFNLVQISGGLSNLIFRCSLPKHMSPKGDEPTAVLLRLYGTDFTQAEDITRYINSRVIDNVIFTILSERGLGPTLHGVFPGGRLEEFIQARSMNPSEVRDPIYSGIIARKIARVHSLKAPLNKEPHWLEKMLTKYQNQIATLSLVNVKPECQQLAQKLLSFDFNSEIKWLLNFLSRVNSPVVFCHNDVQGGNILLREEEEEDQAKNDKDEDSKITIIDYEFCGYNYRAFDLANHLSEWVYDYTNKEFPYFFCQRKNFPTEEKMMEFFRAYLACCPSRNKQSKRRRQMSLDENEVRALFKEVQAFLLAPSLLWCMWGMANSTNNNNIPFGYWQYSTDRMNDYVNQKNLLVSASQQQEKKKKSSLN